MQNIPNEVLAGGIALIALFYAGILAWRIKSKKVENVEADNISKMIQEGARAFLKKEYQVLAIFVIVVALILAFTNIGWKVALAFVFGAVLSIAAGFTGMTIATLANVRVAEEAQKDIIKGLRLAFNSGSVMGLTVVGLGVFGVSLLYYIFRDPNIIYGLGFGASSVALFARVGGGIYTKAADVGADLVGKLEAGIPEDDPRNPAVIADNVGDNVGDVAGMGADLFESYVDSIIAAMVLGLVLFAGLGEGAIVFPLALAAAGILASILGNLLVGGKDKQKLTKALNRGIFGAAIIMTVLAFFLTRYFFGDLKLFWVVVTGLAAGIIIGLVTEFYTSNNYKPAQKIAEAAKTGAATNILAGLSTGMLSTLIPIATVSAAIFISYQLAGIYGIAIAAVGMLSTLGITLATDCYGPVADNSAGIAEMAKMGKEVRERAENLDAVGNTTAAIGKGFAIGSAALTALALLVSYAQVTRLDWINLVDYRVIIGLFIGGLMPFLFCAFALSAVGKAAMEMVEEVRRQFREIRGLMEGKAKPESARAIAISTQAAIKQMILPGLLAVIVPVVMGFVLGKEALAGLLAGSVVTGFLMAVMMANSGGAWDNAKKYIEAGNLGGKGSDAHKAAVVGDTVGDPFKDTAGPSLNILIKLMSIIALIIAPLL